MKRVGYWMSEKKKKKLNFEEHRELFRNAGLELVQVDLARPMEDQGPFDLLVHKIAEVIAKANLGDPASVWAIHNVESYIKAHPECVVLDPLDSVRTVLDRFTQYQCVLHSDVMHDNRVMIPTFVELNSPNLGDNKEKLAQAGVTFPLVCKPNLAHGSNAAHQMSILFSEEGLRDVSTPCVAMSFINHNAILYKIMVVGCRQFIVQRPSLRNLYPGNHPTVFFDTQQVSKPDSDHPLNAVDYSTLEDQPVKPDWGYLDRLGQQMRKAMNLDLFGFDVIIDSETNQYGIIDINFFPGFEAIDNFFGFLASHIAAVLEARDKGQLVDGRLIAPDPSPHGTTQLNILDQLNHKRGRNHANRSSGKSPLVTSSPIIDLSPRSNMKNKSGITDFSGLDLTPEKDGPCFSSLHNNDKSSTTATHLLNLKNQNAPKSSNININNNNNDNLQPSKFS